MLNEEPLNQEPVWKGLTKCLYTELNQDVTSLILEKASSISFLLNIGYLSTQGLMKIYFDNNCFKSAVNLYNDVPDEIMERSLAELFFSYPWDADKEGHWESVYEFHEKTYISDYSELLIKYNNRLIHIFFSDSVFQIIVGNDDCVTLSKVLDNVDYYSSYDGRILTMVSERATNCLKCCQEKLGEEFWSVDPHDLEMFFCRETLDTIDYYVRLLVENERLDNVTKKLLQESIEGRLILYKYTKNAEEYTSS